LGYFADIRNILWPFGIFCVHFVNLVNSGPWYHVPRQIWQPCLISLSSFPHLIPRTPEHIP
jgi:hypothetical protein